MFYSSLRSRWDENVKEGDREDTGGKEISLIVLCRMVEMNCDLWRETETARQKEEMKTE